MSRPLPSGDPVRLGPFRLTARLTETAAGIVYLAVDDDGRRASLAVLSRDAAEDAAARDRFRAAILAALPSPEHGRTPGRPYSRTPGPSSGTPAGQTPPPGVPGGSGAPGAPGAAGVPGGGGTGPGVPGAAASTLTETGTGTGQDAGAGQGRPQFAAPDGIPGADGPGGGGVAEVLAAQPDGPAPWVATAYDGRSTGAERFLEPVVPHGALRGRWGGIRRRGPLFQPYWSGNGEPALAPRPGTGAGAAAPLPVEQPPERSLVAAILTLAGVLAVLAVLLVVLFACQPDVKNPPPQPSEPSLQTPPDSPTTVPATPMPKPTPQPSTPTTPDPSGTSGGGDGGSV
ncbi:hypothetical protein [Actinomadura rupiterrae]|uniref:hypothetical protein n=1 Tax=Actinomadura rupiterrae TaxID=559627 RepID=UPI0020A25890|nr:hypothetical protein [Actinomadura rupiterrae]MCP2343294.1 hypothetical protein [Actinomadura rupiterrae]